MKLKLLKILKRKNQTAYLLSLKSGVDLKTIYRLTTNETKGGKFSTLDKIARALDVSIDELFDREDHS